jgi:uncharacterized protein (DUF2164 family)
VTRITLSHERRKKLVSELGPAVYNQAIRDAQGFLQQRIEDLDVEYFEEEEPRGP